MRWILFLLGANCDLSLPAGVSHQTHSQARRQALMQCGVMQLHV